MTIPNFKSIDDYKEFVNLFDDRWQVKFELLNRVKDDMYGRPGFAPPEWSSLPPHSVETINDIVQSLLYDVEFTFKESHPDYKNADDDIFIPRRAFKEDVLSALNEALTPYELTNKECPPCDTIACADHLADD